MVLSLRDVQLNTPAEIDRHIEQTVEFIHILYDRFELDYISADGFGVSLNGVPVNTRQSLAKGELRSVWWYQIVPWTVVERLGVDRIRGTPGGTPAYATEIREDGGAVIRVTEKPDDPDLAERLAETCEQLVLPSVWDYRVND